MKNIKNLEKEEAVALWGTIAGGLIYILNIVFPHFDAVYTEAIRDLVVVGGPLMVAVLRARSQVYSKETVQQMQMERWHG